MTALIDSSSWVDFFAGATRGKPVQTLLDSGEKIIMSSINLFEIYSKFFKYSEQEADEKRFFLLARTEVVPADKEIVVSAAKLKIQRGLSLADAIVWATAEKHGAKLVTADRDFRGYMPLELLR